MKKGMPKADTAERNGIMVQLYEHNQKTYDNLIKLFADRDRVACVQPTGTGKSFIMLKLIEDNPERKFLITSPSVYIFEQIKIHAEGSFLGISNCEFLTYQKITGMSEEAVKSIEADYIILDEFHRLGSSEWGSRGMDMLLKSHSCCKVLGTSATPIRYLDSMRNMAEEIFDSCYAVNMNLAEAIRLKILPLPVYITAWYSFSDEIQKIEGKFQNTKDQYIKDKIYAKIQKAKARITDTDCGMEKVLEKHIENKNGKYIIFCPNVESLENAKGECSSWFRHVNKNLHVYSVYSYGENTKEQFEQFINDSSKNSLKVLLCIDMLNEGIHIKGIDGVIMLRATKSANVFYQQLGRALSCSKSRPVIFDVVNNYETGDTARMYESMMEVGLEYRSDGSDKDITFEIYDYVRDIRTLLDDIYHTFEQDWEASFEMLCEFVKESERFPHDVECYKGYRLGTWCQAQRKLYKNNRLSAERVSALENIGFMWTPAENIWNGRYCALKKFKEKYGRFPVLSDARENDEVHVLYSWCQTQRKNYKSNILSNEHKLKLEEIGFRLEYETNNEIWENNYHSVKEIYLRLKRFPDAQDIKDEKLRRWITEQRRKLHKNNLSQERIQRLNEIGFIWDIEDKRWNDSFEILKEFIAENSHVPSVKDKYRDISVGQWYRKQRSFLDKGTLSPERSGKLRSLDTELTSYADAQWMRRFGQLETFINTYGRYPRTTELYEGVNLYDWIYCQKQRLINNKLEEKYCKAFEGINCDLMNFGTDAYGDLWLEKFGLLERFIKENNRLPRSGDVYEETDLYWWLNHQKLKFKNNELEEKYLKKFESININLLESSASVKETWERNFELLQRFIEEHGRCPYNGEKYGDADLYAWIIRQKKKLKKHELEDEYADKLKSLNIDLSSFSSRSLRRAGLWEEKFDILVRFMNEYGRCPRDGELYEEVDLYKWLMKEKSRIKKYGINDEHREKLESIGIDIFEFPSGRTDKWQERFEQVRTFIVKFNRFPHSGESYEGFQPYKWIMLQKSRLDNNSLDDRYVEKFKSLNIDLLKSSAGMPAEPVTPPQAVGH